MEENKEKQYEVLLCKYQHAYDILMDYFDDLPDDIKIKLDIRLAKIDL